MSSFRRSAATLVLAFAGPAFVSAAPLYFRVEAEVTESDIAGAPPGSYLTGWIVYDPEDLQRQVGGSYYPARGSSGFRARGSGGFSIYRELAALSVVPGDPLDNVSMQAQLTDYANDWNIWIELSEPGGWLGGTNRLPTEYPAGFGSGSYIQIIFTDEWEWIRYLEARPTSIAPAPEIPLPGAVALLASALLVVWSRATRRLDALGRGESAASVPGGPTV